MQPELGTGAPLPGSRSPKPGPDGVRRQEQHVSALAALRRQHSSLVRSLRPRSAGAAAATPCSRSHACACAAVKGVGWCRDTCAEQEDIVASKAAFDAAYTQFLDAAPRNMHVSGYAIDPHAAYVRVRCRTAVPPCAAPGAPA